MKLAITKLNEEDILLIRGAVESAVMYWPNAGGPETPRENMRSAFRQIRRAVIEGRIALHYACLRLEEDALRHADM